MKKWETPELLELKTAWTQTQVNAAGNDSHGETVNIGGEDLPLGSC